MRELRAPKRSPILLPPSPPSKPPQADSVRRWRHPAFGWALALAGVVALCVALAISWPSPEQRAKARAESAAADAKTTALIKALNSSPSPAPVATPSSPSVQQQAPANATLPAVQTPVAAPRAKLVRLPSPRVHLVELDPEHIDETHVVTMPYGTVVRATLRGFLGTENQLPRVGHIGDMYVVERTPWVFIQVPGTTAPTWVDP